MLNKAANDYTSIAKYNHNYLLFIPTQAHALDSHIAKEGAASLPLLAGIPIAIKV
jgi:Asp-tRNA(Asn)/Glu-tRNA(Gln) amidotransferase A subunit family amidase